MKHPEGPLKIFSKKYGCGFEACNHDDKWLWNCLPESTSWRRRRVESVNRGVGAGVDVKLPEDQPRQPSLFPDLLCLVEPRRCTMYDTVTLSTSVKKLCVASLVTGGVRVKWQTRRFRRVRVTDMAGEYAINRQIEKLMIPVCIRIQPRHHAIKPIFSDRCIFENWYKNIRDSHHAKGKTISG